MLISIITLVIVSKKIVNKLFKNSPAILTNVAAILRKCVDQCIQPLVITEKYEAIVDQSPPRISHYHLCYNYSNTNAYFFNMAAKLPREAGKFIASCCNHVTIKEEGVTNAARLIYPKLRNSLHSVKNWRKAKLHPKELSESTVNWIFVLDTLNFSFWVDDDMEPFLVEYQSECYTGYWALCAAINRALEASKIVERV